MKVLRLNKPATFFIIFFLCYNFPIIVVAQKATTLGDYIHKASASSPLLNDYNNQIYNSKLDSLKLLAGYNFIVTGEGSALYSPNYKGWGYDNALTNGHPLAAMIRVSKQFIGKKNLDSRLSSYYLSIQQIQNQSQLSSLQLEKSISDLYTAAYISQQGYKGIQDVLKILNQEDVILKKLTQAAVFKQTDYLSFKVTLQQNELSLEQKKAEWYNNFTLLNYACGLVDTTLSELEPPVFDSLNPPLFDESIYKKSFKTDSLKLTNDARLIHYDYQPKLSTYADAGYQSTLVQTPYKNFGWSVGVSLSVPIYDGKRKQLSLQQNKIALQTRQKYIDFAQSQYQQQIALIQNQIHQYTQIIATSNEQLKYAYTLIEANAKQLPTGDVKVVDFILSISNYYNLKMGIIQYEGILYSLKNQLQHLILQ